MRKKQLIEGLTAELYGLIGAISVYKRADGRCFEQEYKRVQALRKEAVHMNEKEIRKQFQNLRVELQIKYMLGMRALRCRYCHQDGRIILTEFHTGDQIILTHPIDVCDIDNIGYMRIKGKVTNILGDSTIIMEPENSIRLDGNAC